MKRAGSAECAAARRGLTPDATNSTTVDAEMPY
jgi:hypothetical protein